MAIYCVLGAPGAGKSYETVRRFVIHACKINRKIITNLPLQVDEIVKKFPSMDGLIEIRQGNDLKNPYSTAFENVKDLQDDWVNEKGNRALIIIDEAHFCVGKQKGEKALLPYEDFFSTHRQEGYDIILITQTSIRLSKRVLAMVETFYNCFNKSAIGLDRLYEVVLTTSHTEKINKFSQRETFSYNQEIYNLYRSHALSDNPIQELKPNKPSLYQILKMWWFVPAFILFLIFIIYRFSTSETNFSLSPQNKEIITDKKIDNKNQISTENQQIDKPQAQAISEKKDKKKSVKDLRPYKDFQIFIDGTYEENFEKVFILSFDKDGEKQFSIHSNQLKLLKIIPFSQYEDCIAILQWREETEYIYCKPQEKEEKDENVFSTANEHIPTTN